MPKEIIFTPAVDSTQLEAQRLLNESHLRQPAGVLFHVATNHQTAGRGRFSRTWEDQANTCSLTSTVVKLPNRALANAHWLTIAADLSVTETVRGFFPHTQTSLKLKWPNDVLFQGAKLGGVLATALSTQHLSASDPEHTYISVGIGVNLLQPAADLPTAEATSLAAAKLVPLPEISEFNRRLLTLFTYYIERFTALDYAASSFQTAYENLLAGVGQEVTVTHLRPEVTTGKQRELADSADTYRAIFRGVSARGWARVTPLANPDTELEISSADITFAPTQSPQTPVTPASKEAK